jgi:hypothetical protein
LFIESKFVGGCLQFEDLKGELAPQRFGDPKISPGPWFQITKPLSLANLAQRATIIVQGFEFEALMVVLDPTALGTSEFHRGPDFK